MSSGKAHIGPDAANASASSVRGARTSVAKAPRDIPALSCRGLTFRYAEGETPVFSDISLSVQPGETLLVMGPSGCGKSTLAYCLAGLYPDYAGVLEGSVEVEGRPIDRMGPQERSRAVSILFQNPDNQFCMDTVLHEVLFALENVDCPGDLDARAHELLELAGLDGYARSPIHTLSGGTKQKLALVTALATGARTLVLDEPFANLDPLSCRRLAGELERLKRRGVTLVVVDHKPGWWLPFCSRIIFMERKGNLDELAFSPAEAPARREAFAARGLFLGSDWLRGVHPPHLAGDASAALEARDLTVRHGRTPFLSGLSLALPRGSVTSLVGECGSGKSTLLTALAGAARFSGSVESAGRVGLVFQNPRFQFLALTVSDEVLITLRASRPGVPDEQLVPVAHGLLEEFGLDARAQASPYELSQGQQRRLALLAMLAADCDVLLLDEPTYAQDERSTRFILELLMKRVERGLAVLVATHDVELARAISNQVLLLEDGSLRALSPQEVDRYVEERKEPPCGA